MPAADLQHIAALGSWLLCDLDLRQCRRLRGHEQADFVLARVCRPDVKWMMAMLQGLEGKSDQGSHDTALHASSVMYGVLGACSICKLPPS